MRNKWYLMLAALLIAILALGACGGGGDAEPTVAPAVEAPAEAPAEATEAPAEAPAEATEAPAEEAEATAVPAEESEVMTDTEAMTDTAAVTDTAAASTGPKLVIWADEQRVRALEPLADSFEAETGVALELVEKGFGQIRDDFKVAGPAGQGPDILIGAHDWLGELAASGLLAEVSLGDRADEFVPVAVDAFNYDGKLYGMPYAVENVAFVYNPDLVETAPETWDDVKTISQELVDGGMKYGYIIEENDPYHFYGIQTAFGGYVFGTNEDGSWNPEDVGIDSEGTIAAGDWLDGMYKDGLLTPGAALNGDLVIAAYTNGDAAMAILGPWRLDALRESGVPYEIIPIPAGPAGPGSPFLGVQGFMVSAFSKQPLLAQTFLQQFVGTDETMMALYNEGGRPTAMTAVNANIEDPDQVKFAEAGVAGQPMPNIPAMSAVWASWGNAMALIGQQAETPEKAFTDAADQIRAAIAAE
jgi:maltose-binding protein MalE